MKLSDLINEDGAMGGGTTTASVNQGASNTPPLGSNLKRTKKRKYNGDVVNGEVDLAANDPSFTEKSPSTNRKTQFKGDVLNDKIKHAVTYTTDEIKAHLKQKLTDDMMGIVGIFKSNTNKNKKDK
jgi:hypothetical protein